MAGVARKQTKREGDPCPTGFGKDQRQSERREDMAGAPGRRFNAQMQAQLIR